MKAEKGFTSCNRTGASFMATPTVLVLGARSDIGMATARRFAQAGHPVQLAARNVKTLEQDRRDLEQSFGVTVTLHEFDVLTASTHEDFLDSLDCLPETVICAIGLMGNQCLCESEPDAAALVIRSNFEGPAAILSRLASLFEARGSGTLVGISSVAGERGRASNYIYGAAKAGFTAFLSGLRARMSSKGVRVITVLPGYVQTKMTRNIPLPALMTAMPVDIAEAIFHSVRAGKHIVYAPGHWRLIAAILKLVPERVFMHISSARRARRVAERDSAPVRGLPAGDPMAKPKLTDAA